MAVCQELSLPLFQICMTQKHNPPWSLEPGAQASPVWATAGGGRAFVLRAYAGSQEVAQGTSTRVGKVEGD